MGSLSPVSSDSSISSPADRTTSPSTTTWSPGLSSQISSATTASVATSSDRPSRTTRARGIDITTSRLSTRRACSSWPMPMRLLDTITPANRASPGYPAARMAASSAPMMAFTGVKTLARTIWPTVRTGAAGVRLTRPSATRSATSAAVSPAGGELSGPESSGPAGADGLVGPGPLAVSSGLLIRSAPA